MYSLPNVSFVTPNTGEIVIQSFNSIILLMLSSNIDIERKEGPKLLRSRPRHENLPQDLVYTLS